MGAMRRGWRLLLVIALSGCATIVPPELADRLARDVSGRDVIADPLKHRGAVVMMGGVILGVRSDQQMTEIELLERPLEDEEPVMTDRTAGRFLARQPGFLDPAAYGVGRRVTVVGTVADPVDRKLGEVEQRDVVIDAQRIHLWPERTYVYRYPPPYWGYPYYWGYFYWGSPYWYDPFWDPFWHRHRRLRR